VPEERELETDLGISHRLTSLIEEEGVRFPDYTVPIPEIRVSTQDLDEVYSILNFK